MPSSTLIAPLYGLISGTLWGFSDFTGGIASRKAATSAFTVVLFTQLIGMGLLMIPAIILKEPWPPLSDVLLASVASAIGIAALAALFKAMAIGQIGIASPITSVLATGIPVAYGSLTAGLPPTHRMIGFGLALIGVVLLSLQSASTGTATGVSLALVAGIGIAGFFILIAQISSGAVFWPLVMARATAITIVLIYIFSQRQFTPPKRTSLPFIALSGGLNALGNVFFLVAQQMGRFDIIAVLGSLSPVGTVLLAVIFLRERFTGRQTLGALLTLAAILLLSL